MLISDTGHKLSSMADNKKDELDDYGVLLYYKYASIPELEQLYAFYDSNCNSLGLLGRVRIAPHGVNVTVGGKMSSLVKHIDSVKSNSLFEGTDFKLASCHQPSNDSVAKECGFTSLSIRIVKELVTFSSYPLPKSPEVSQAGMHLSAEEFHDVIQNAGKLIENGTPSQHNGLVLLDARNLYETRIGKFDTPNVETLDPEIRQYSDLPSWIDNNSEQLRGNRVLMYCTGGIRCEMASAYIKSKGAGFENVFQLYGGIQRYLEQFPDGGFFKGKNFVFDHRVSVGSSNTNILGSCLLCGSSFDDYSSRCRCTHCRMLVLVCGSCRETCSQYVCELCKKSGKHVPIVEDDQSQLQSTGIDIKTVSASDPAPFSLEFPARQGISSMRKLRILCLHGFRQNASNFKGRTASLAKKIKNIAELVFIDAPHELPFIFQPSQESPPPPSCSTKFAWLVAPNNFNSKSDDDCNWKMADRPFDLLQYQQQTDGFDVSLSYLKTVFSRLGPFDGMLGFSQGAAMVAAVCGEMDFRFVILCSGFAFDFAKRNPGSINCPSLHIFGDCPGKDRQISVQASRDLASLFEEGCSEIIEHDSGHIIPTRSPYINKMKDFLRRFL